MHTPTKQELGICLRQAQQHALKRRPDGIVACPACDYQPQWGDDLPTAAAIHQTRVIIDTWERSCRA